MASKVPCIAICLYRVSTKFRHRPAKAHYRQVVPAATKVRFSPYNSFSPQFLPLSLTEKMITKFMTEVTAKFNPFSTCAKPARLFLTFLPPNVRANGTVVNTALLPRDSAESSSLRVKFSTLSSRRRSNGVIEHALTDLRRGWQRNGLQLLENQH